MKLRILSDLHLGASEHSHIDAIKQGDEDVVVCAGDVSNDGVKSLMWLRQTFPDKAIVFVPGNHEYYGSNIADMNASMLKVGEDLSIRVLLNDFGKLGDIKFVGSTLWSNFQLFHSSQVAYAMSQSERYVNDFYHIEVNPSQKLSAHYVLHNLFAPALKFLEEQLETDEKRVVVTHFAPCTKSVAERYQHDPVTPYFVNNLDYLMGRAPLFIHGHCHTAFDYECNGSRVVCNPSGYRNEGTKFNPDLIVEA